MTCRAPPRAPSARARTSSTSKPALRARQVNFGFGFDDHTASTPPGRSAARAALNPFRSYSASLVLRVSPSGPLSTSSRIASIGRPLGADQLADVGFADADARIGQARAEHLGHRAARPGHDRRHELGDDDPRGPARARPARRASVKPMPSPPIKIRGAVRSANPLAGDGRQRLLGAAEPAVHQLVLTQHDREFGAALLQAESRRRRALEPCRAGPRESSRRLSAAAAPPAPAPGRAAPGCRSPYIPRANGRGRRPGRPRRSSACRPPRQIRNRRSRR